MNCSKKLRLQESTMLKHIFWILCFIHFLGVAFLTYKMAISSEVKQDKSCINGYALFLQILRAATIIIMQPAMAGSGGSWHWVLTQESPILLCIKSIWGSCQSTGFVLPAWRGGEALYFCQYPRLHQCYWLLQTLWLVKGNISENPSMLRSP